MRSNGGLVVGFRNVINRTGVTLLGYLTRTWTKSRRGLGRGKPLRNHAVTFTVRAESAALVVEAVEKLALALGATLERAADGSPKWVSKDLGAPAGVVFVVPLLGPRRLAMRWNGEDYTWEESTHERGAFLTVRDNERELLEAHRTRSDANVRVHRFRQCVAALGIRVVEVDWGLE